MLKKYLTNKRFIFSLCFTGLILLSAFLRFYKIQSIPPGMTLDEVSIGYNAFLLLNTGKDQDGNFMPISHFRSLHDYKLPLQFYLSVISQSIFGNTAFAVRFPSALFSIFLVIIVFLFVRELFDVKTGLLAAFLLAISPWAVFHSHLGLETNAALFFFTTGIFFLFKSLKNINYLLIATVFFILTIYTYHVYWVFLPFITFIFFALHKKVFFRNKYRLSLSVSLIILCLSLLPLVFENYNAGNKTRFNQSIFSEERLTRIRSSAERVCFNKWICTELVFSSQLVGGITSRYMLGFSFLSLYAPVGFDLVDVLPNRGLFYFLEFPLLITGFIILIKKKDKLTYFFIAWFLVYPIPLAITSTLSAARMITLLPLPQIVESLGLMLIIHKLKRKSIVLIPLFLLLLLRFVSDMWFVYPFKYSRFTDYGQLAIIDYIRRNPEKTYYIEDTLLHPLHLLFFYRILPSTWSLNDRSREKGVVLKQQNIYLVKRGYSPPDKKNKIFISFKEDIPEYYNRIGFIKLISEEPFAYISEKK